MRQIEIVGMRKNRDLKIVITIIILAIISIIVCGGIIIYNRQKVIETSAGLSGDSNNAVAVSDEKDSQEETQETHNGRTVPNACATQRKEAVALSHVHPRCHMRLRLGLQRGCHRQSFVSVNSSNMRRNHGD